MYASKVSAVFGLVALTITLIFPSLVFAAPLAGSSSNQDSPTVSVGVGFILNKLDHTSDSFSLAWYLHKHPIEVNGNSVPVRLVDHSSEADYSVSGHIEGDVSYTYGAMPNPHQYSWRQEANLKLRKSGTKAENVYFVSTGSVEESQVIPSIRALALKDVWKQLAEHLQQRIARDLQSAGSVH